ncbi:hypothetical protein ACTHAM_000865, partial [Cellulomonas soli]|uniref:hypothetical protein n=1 Tax=Cellulomonas soli TaxID=931535 RepID=UPI003F87481E
MTADSQGATGWEFSDAWILAAIGDGTLIGAADYYNHAVPTEVELSQGIGRLLASGLIAEVGPAWKPTTASTALWARSTGSGYLRIASLLEAMSSVALVEGIWKPPSGALDRGSRRYARPFTWMLPPRRRG